MNKETGFTFIAILISIGLVAFVIVSGIFVADRYTLTKIINEEVDRLNSPTQISTEDETTQTVPASGFEDVPEMIVNGGDSIAEPEPSVPSESVPFTSSQSQILEDQVNQALLESLYNQDNDKAWEHFYSFNDAWRENPARNCRNKATYSYEIAELIMGGLEDSMIRKYGKSLSWRKTIEFTFKSWCLDRGY